MAEPTRTTRIPTDYVDELDELKAALGLKNRSEVHRMALREGIRVLRKREGLDDETKAAS